MVIKLIGPAEFDNEGWVTLLGVICPFLRTTFRLKGVNQGKIKLLSGK